MDNIKVIAKSIKHPTKPSTRGDLVKHRDTGIYVMECYFSVVSVPQHWARKIERRTKLIPQP